MSELISIAILAGLALWGYGCCLACDARARRSERPKARVKNRVIAAMLLILITAIHIAKAQMPQTKSTLATPIAATSATVVPMLVRYDGAVVSADQTQTKTGPATFLVYKDETGGEALWTETQSVAFDAKGKYEVYLGSTRSSGLPADLFGSGEARWLEVQMSGEPVQSRTLLVSVPYAMKAGDSATLGGLPASAFVRAGGSGATSIATPDITTDASASGVTTSGGTAGLIPVFTGASTIGNSILYASSTGIGVGKAPSTYGILDIGGQSIFRGPLDVARTGNASASTGTNSNPLLFNFQFYNSTAKYVYNPYFSFQAEATGNNTASPAGTMNLLYYNGIGSAPAETGLAFNTDGTIHFALNQTFSATASANGFGIEGTSVSSIGVYGQSASSAGVQGDSSTGSGVSGSSVSGSGVLGTSYLTQGVQGVSSLGSGVQGSTNGSVLNTAGVVGQANGTSGFTGIAGVWGDTTNHVGVYGTSTQAAGVLGISANGAGIQGTSTNSFAGQFSVSNSGATVYSVNTASVGGSSVYGVSSGSDGVGVFGTASGSGASGVRGEANSGNGVAGVSNQVGVHGIGGSSTVSFSQLGINGPIGLWGDVTGSPVIGAIGILASAENSAAGYMSNDSAYATLQLINYGSGVGEGGSVIFRTLQASSPEGTCGFGGKGDMTCTGQVKSLATTGNGARTVETYSMQSPENWMEDFGSGTLTGGVAKVMLETAFAETVSGSADYHVFLTPRGDSRGLYVTNTTATGFEVHESGGGTAAIGFDYRIVAKRKGFESQRMVDVTEAMKAVKARNDRQAQQFKTAAK